MVAFVASGVQIVSQFQTMVVERLGKYHRNVTPGLNLIWPIIERTKSFKWKTVEKDEQGNFKSYYVTSNKIDLRETNLIFPNQSINTKDNTFITISIIVYFQINDPKEFVYGITDSLYLTIHNVIKTALIETISKKELEEILAFRQDLNNNVLGTVKSLINNKGIQVTRLEITEIILTKEIEEALEKRRQIETERKAMILNAKANKEATMLQAEANAFKIKAISDNLAHLDKKLLDYHLATQYIDTLKDITSGKNNKIIYFPYESAQFLSLLKNMSQENLKNLSNKEEVNNLEKERTNKSK